MPRTAASIGTRKLSRASIAITVAAGITFSLFWIIGANPAHWAARTADAMHSYRIRYKGGIDWFFPERPGWFVDHALWIFLGLLLCAVVADQFGRRCGEPHR